MSKTKILIILGAVAGLILVVGLAVGLTHQSKPSTKNEIFGQDETTSGHDEATSGQNNSTSSPTETTDSSLVSTTTALTIEVDWGQWSDWTPCSQYCRQARMLRLK